MNNHEILDGIIDSQRLKDYENIHKSLILALEAKATNRKLAVYCQKVTPFLKYILKYYKQHNVEIAYVIVENGFERFVDDIEVITAEKIGFDNLDTYLVYAERRPPIVLGEKVLRKRFHYMRRAKKFIKFAKKHQFKENAICFQGCFFRTSTPAYMEYVSTHREELHKVLDVLWDAKSKETFLEIIRAHLSNDVYRLEEGITEKKYWETYRHLEDECWVNCGSATGDTLLYFLNNGYSYEHIYCYEGFHKNAMECSRVINALSVEMADRIELIEQYIGLNNSENNFDNIFDNKKVTLINMDIEGAELDVMRGMKQVMRKQTPVLAICGYHKPEHLIEIPRLMSEIPDYRITLRKYSAGDPMHLGEYVYYAVPDARMVESDEDN